MAPQTRAQNYADEIKKIVYGTFYDILNVQTGVLPQIFRLGISDYTPGGKNFTVMLDFGYGGSGGVATGGGDVSHVGNREAGRKQVSFSYTETVARAVANAREFREWRAGGNAAEFYDRALRKIQGAQNQHMALMDALHMASVGDGRLAAVTTVGAAIANGATGTLVADRKQQLIPETTVQILLVSDGTTIVGPFTITESIGRGPGEVSIINQSGSSYTPAVGDIVFLSQQNVAPDIYFASLDESISAINYPPRGPNTTPVDVGYYKSVVHDANGGKFSVPMFKAAWDQFLSESLQGASEAQLAQNENGDWTYTSVALMPFEHRSALSAEIENQRRYAGTIDAVDPGWGAIKVCDGVPIAVAGRCPEDTVYFIDATGWIGVMDNLEQLSTGEVAGAFQRIPRSTNYEALFATHTGFYCVNRRKQAKIKNVTGFTLADAGLTNES